MKNVVVLIMAGGSGERFWPLSTKERPKQLLNLVDDKKTLIRLTVDRILPLTEKSRIFIATNSVQAPAIREELPDIPYENVIIEPQFKDTAAAIGFGAVYISKRFKDATMVVLASDHLITKEEKFTDDIVKAIDCAQSGNCIVTLGIKPTRAETGYGYLEIPEDALSEKVLNNPVKVLRFCEKPLHEIAVEYLRRGNYLWNSGMFVFGIPLIMEAFDKYMPHHSRVLQKIALLNDYTSANNIEKLSAFFSEFNKISIDYGIMEKFPDIRVIAASFSWSDIGSYTALEEVFPFNENGSIIKGANVKEVDSNGNIIISTTGRNISVLGVKECIIVDTGENLLVCTKKEAQNIKKLLK